MSKKMRPAIIATRDGPREVLAMSVQGTPFIIHQSHELQNGPGVPWKVTHEKTGYAALSFCRSKASAFTAAKELAALGCDWDFSNPKEAAAIGKQHRYRILEIRNKATGAAP